MSKRIIIFILFLVIFSFTACSEELSTKILLTGNWYRKEIPSKTVEQEYGWGTGKTVNNFTLEIDLYYNPGKICLPMIGGPFEIKNINLVEDNTYDLTFYFDRGNFDVVYRLHFLDNEKIWIELLTDRELSFFPIGQENIYYKIDGPESLE